MSFLNKFRRGGNTTNAPLPTSNTVHHETWTEKRAAKKAQRRSHNNHPNSAFPSDGLLNRRPSFGQWLKYTWLDLLTMVAMGVVGLGIYEAHPRYNRSFPVFFQDGEIVYPEFAYPLRKELVPIWLAALLGSLIPIAVILIAQIKVRSFWDVNNAIIGLLYSLITAAVFQVFVKWLIGGLRPHFLDVCQPNVPITGPKTGNGFTQIMYDRTICTGDESLIDDSLESMPSGHSTAAFAGFVYLYLYLNAKLKVWANYHPAMWKLILTYTPILGACLIGGSLTIDEFHNWYDVLAGAIIGTVMAFSAYRMVYASVWDFRFNHIPLMRHVPFEYSLRSEALGGFEHAVVASAAGWGSGAPFMSGAPFDASAVSGAGFAGMGGANGVLGGAGSHGNHHHRTRSASGPGANTGYDNTLPRTPRKSIERRPVAGSGVRGDQMV